MKKIEALADTLTQLIGLKLLPNHQEEHGDNEVIELTITREDCNALNITISECGLALKFLQRNGRLSVISTYPQNIGSPEFDDFGPVDYTPIFEIAIIYSDNWYQPVGNLRKEEADDDHIIFNIDSSELNVFGDIVLISERQKKNDAHILLEHLIENPYEAFDYVDHEEIFGHRNGKSNWKTADNAARYLRSKISRTTDFLYMIGKPDGHVEIREEYRGKIKLSEKN